MTGIITITGGIEGIGKTHLAVNLSLELVRRGHQVGLFHIPNGDAPVERFIDIQPLVERRQQEAAVPDQQHVISRGYLGIDIVSCTLPLAKWHDATDALLADCVESMDVEEGYDHFIVDTSGMMPRELIGCCLASRAIVLVVTPDPRSQAEAFALLRVLQLNGFSGELRLLVNRVSGAMDAHEIHQGFNQETGEHLGMKIPAPWLIPEDESVPRAERYRQAFSAVFPDSEAAAAVVVIADEVESLSDDPGQNALSAWWTRFIDIIRAPIQLPGSVLLEEPAGGAAEETVAAATVAEELN